MKKKKESLMKGFKIIGLTSVSFGLSAVCLAQNNPASVRGAGLNPPFEGLMAPGQKSIFFEGVNALNAPIASQKPKEAEKKVSLGHCLATQIKQVIITPAHCVSAEGETRMAQSEKGEQKVLKKQTISLQKDYALLNVEPLRLPNGNLKSGSNADEVNEAKAASLQDNQRISRHPRVTEVIWVKTREKWIMARVTAWGAGALWAKGATCIKPGDSGASAWGFERGEWKWMGMVISGVTEDDCAEEFNILHSSAIALKP